jgi:prostaglandin reductase 3
MPSFRRYEVHTKSTDFRKATHIVEEAELPAAKAGFVVVQNHYVGINATDINTTNGAYTGSLPTPFGCGLEAVGVVVAVGDGVENVTVGTPVAYRKCGAFAE